MKRLNTGTKVKIRTAPDVMQTSTIVKSLVKPCGLVYYTTDDGLVFRSDAIGQTVFTVGWDS